MLLSTFFFTSCQKKIDYFDYVSELRSNIFIAKNDSFSLRVYAVVKESPYGTDGIPREKSSRMETYLLTPEANKTVTITFQIAEQSYGGEMSYDNVKGEYFYSCSADVAQLSSIPCLIVYGEETTEITASSVITANTISPQNALRILQTQQPELFSALTDKYGFAGEIYIRLIFEEVPYYYIGIIDRNEKCNAFLMNAETGKVLARRES